jgi:hypothetical protein
LRLPVSHHGQSFRLQKFSYWDRLIRIEAWDKDMSYKSQGNETRSHRVVE